MSYLSKEEIEEIRSIVSLYALENAGGLLTCTFDSGITEYNDFLRKAHIFDRMNVSKTFLLVHNETDELIGYLAMAADSIKLTEEEKLKSQLESVPFMSIPAIKVGKLAVNKKLCRKAKRKGYGSFLLEVARGIAYEVNQTGIANRFITVDADVEYDKGTIEFYRKNGFIENVKHKRGKNSRTVSMRKDIFQS